MSSKTEKNINTALAITGIGLFSAALGVSIALICILAAKRREKRRTHQTETHHHHSSTSTSHRPPEWIQEEKPEVFLYNVGDSYNFSNKDQAETACQAHDSTLATPEQVENELKNGASWCAYGYTTNGETTYPMQSEDCKACDSKSGIVKSTELVNAGALCYGTKPAPGTEGIYSFDTTKWSKYD
jgi:hypothetical protein